MSDLKLNRVLKADAEQRMVWSEVYAPNRPDSDGEYMTAETIKKMAYDFVKAGRMARIDLNHDQVIQKGVHIVESFIARDNDPDFIPGSWVAGMHVENDEIWAMIKKGEINAFSLEAKVERVEREVRIEMPPIIRGHTSKHEDHQHEFFVSYDANGKYMGGTTNEVNGHVHVIKTGSATEETGGHRHRFSAVDNVVILGDN